MSFGGSASSANITTKNNLSLLRKSTHKGHKFLNVKRSKFSYKRNSNFSLKDTKDIHTIRANKEAILLTLFGVIPFAIFCLYWLGVI